MRAGKGGNPIKGLIQSDLFCRRKLRKENFLQLFSNFVPCWVESPTNCLEGRRRNSLLFLPGKLCVRPERRRLGKGPSTPFFLDLTGNSTSPLTISLDWCMQWYGIRRGAKSHLSIIYPVFQRQGKFSKKLSVCFFSEMVAISRTTCYTFRL